MSNLTIERLREVLHYDHETGVFTWNKMLSPKGGKVGSRAGAVRSDGRTAIGIDGGSYLAYRLAWFYVYGAWPSGELDHINADPADDRIRNLREATRVQNAQNSKPWRTRNRMKGAHWVAEKHKWKSRIVVNGRTLGLGYFQSEEDAHRAYAAAADKYFGDFARAA